MEGTHTDDDGDLSIFASGNILIACNEGHYWLMSAKRKSSPKTKSGVKVLNLDTALSESLTKESQHIYEA